ncbi:hypothetical protein BC938DRAFT_479548 [Jimgerdemannia flammicorona]|uniref:Uncharacterized protein n=1 Tax=Jimgerdemannia flammicorona TaxID=994334 RepID=A0A433QXQ7_9FUNG|nr:hypothetical protein BC938DRAFT_479548 [Jimgerdemannia flammicorona]
MAQHVHHRSSSQNKYQSAPRPIFKHCVAGDDRGTLKADRENGLKLPKGNGAKLRPRRMAVKPYQETHLEVTLFLLRISGKTVSSTLNSSISTL